LKVISCIFVSQEVEMVASWETFAFSLSVGRCGQFRAAGWKRIAWVAFLGSLSHLLINFVAMLWMDLMPLSEIGSTVRRNLDDGTT